MSEHNDDTRNQPNQEETTKFCGKSNTVENMFQKAMPQVPNIGISKTASTGNLQSPVSNRYTKLKAETKVTLSEADGLILRPDTNYLHLNAYSSSVPTSPSLMSPSLSRKSMADGQRYHLRHPSGNTRSSGGSSNASNTRSHSTVVETRHISLEYDPVRKRKLLNTYEILSDLGFGQHGKVKLALDTVTGDKVAIKILDRTGRAKVGAKYYYTGNQDTVTSPPEYMSENEVKIRKEIAIMKKCDHENIVKLREVIDDHRLRKIYLVLEYLEKGEIKWQSEESHEFTTESGEKSIEITTKPVLSFKQARTVFRDVVLGLEYLHYQGIIHRDIKPANLLISKDNIVKISDFGVSFSISFMENSEYDLCKTAGTPAFYAPELCSADTNSVDECGRHIISHKVDIWALGVTLYCLMFGKLPFYGKNDFELFDKISKTEPEIPTFEMFEEYGSDVSESLYKDLVDVLGKLLKKDPHERIDIPELKEHSFLINSLESSNDFHRFYNNIAIYRSDSSSDEEEQTSLRKIDVSKEEMGNAITDIGNKLKSSLSKVLNFTGFSSSTSSLKSRTSMPSISPNVPAQRHRLSVSSMFSKKPTHSHSNSTASSRKNSRSNTVYTPPQVQALRHEDSSLSLKSGAYSINSDQSLPESDFRKALHKTASLYSHNNSTGSSFISPSLQNTQAMSQDYFPVERAMYSNVDVASCSDVLKTHHHKRSVSNTSAQLSDACIEAGFFVHTKPVANTLNGIMERSDKAMRPRVERFESPLNSPSLKGAQSPSIFGLGSKSRNNSFLSSSGYNNGITLPRKSSNVSLPVNSSYASLNSIDDEFLYSSNNDDAKRRVGYITPGYDTEGAVKNNYSGLLNNANSNSGFLNAFNNDASKFRFHEDSIKEKIYGRKNKDLLKFDSYSLSTGPTSSESQAVSRAVSPATDDNRYAASKAPSVSTINEAQSNKTLSHLHRNSSNSSSSSSSSNVSDSSEDLYSTGDDVLQFSAANYQDRTSRAFFMGSGRNSVENTDTESYNQNELRMVDSVVTVPNSIISKLNSADNSTQPSQTQLLSYYTASRATKPGNTAHKSNNIPPNNSVFPKNFMNGEKQLKFQFGAAEDDDRESDDTDASSDRSLFFPNPDLLNRKLVTQRNLSDDSKSSIKSSGDESDQELTFNFNGRKLVSDRSKSISQASDRNKSISQASQASKASDISHGN